MKPGKMPGHGNTPVGAARGRDKSSRAWPAPTAIIKWLAKRFRVSRTTERNGVKHYFFGIKGRF